MTKENLVPALTRDLGKAIVHIQKRFADLPGVRRFITTLIVVGGHRINALCSTDRADEAIKLMTEGDTFADEQAERYAKSLKETSPDV